MPHFTEEELNHLFVALILHTKTTRAEQAAWLDERAHIWRKIVAASGVAESEQTIYRSKLFDCPVLLQSFWKTPTKSRRRFSEKKPGRLREPDSRTTEALIQQIRCRIPYRQQPENKSTLSANAP
jgi:hypothetical protein